jgi:hypothetical protein
MKMFRTKLRMALFVILAALAVGMPQLSAHGQGQAKLDTETLVRVELKGPIQTIGLPIYAHLLDGAGNDYALVIAPINQIAGTGLPYQVLDDPACPGTYYFARERRKGARQAAAELFTILHDDGRRILVKGNPEVADKLSELGFDINAIPIKPMILRTPFDINQIPSQKTISRTSQPSITSAFAVTRDPRVAAMVDLVQQTALYDEIGNLSGENAVTISGNPYIMITRHTTSGAPIQNATQYVYERIAAMGLTVSFHDWSISPYTNRNIVGTKTGKTKPSEIVLITAHLDDMPLSGAAPGADDNASGSAALLMAAKIMASGTFERTIRFVFFTGEEQGLYGSRAYSDAASLAGENIVAVYNMDMISWDAIAGPTLRLHTRTPSNPGYHADMAIAVTFSDVVAAYGLSPGLTPIITSDGETASDHSSFWHNGYAAILAIEDDYDDFTPYYHTAGDIRQRLNMIYFTNYAKASVGTVAHLALPTDAPPSSGSGRCFVATVAFGSPMAGQVEILRQFRDSYLLTNNRGRQFVAWYYRNGPAAAGYIEDKPLAKAAVQAALYPLIGFSLLLISGYLPLVIIGLFLSALLFFQVRSKKLSGT